MLLKHVPNIYLTCTSTYTFILTFEAPRTARGKSALLVQQHRGNRPFYMVVPLKVA